VLVEVVIGRAGHGADVHDHGVEETRDRLGDCGLVRIRLDRDREANHLGHGVRVRARGIDDHVRTVASVRGAYAYYLAAFDVDACNWFVEPELGAEPARVVIERVQREQRRAVPILGGEGAADQPIAVQVGQQVQHFLAFQPVDVQPVFLLDDQQFFEDLLLALAISHEDIAARVPFDIVAVHLMPRLEDLQAAQVESNFGRVGMGGAHAADGGLVRSLARTGPAVEHEGAQAGASKIERGRHADAACARDDHVIMRNSVHRRFHRPPPAPAKTARGTSMKSGRLVPSTTSASGTPSSRKSRRMSAAQVFEPQEPMPARVTVLISLTSR